jgi:RNA polymerase sigma factor (sigma-70 family)
MNEDTELLRRFAEEGAQDAFAELVRQKIDLVYATALRQTGGDAHLAQDVTQGVFLALACQAETLKRHVALIGWLYTTTRFVAAKAVRAQARWQRREQEANLMTIEGGESDAAWAELRPVIDDALHELDEKDRVALLLRFFEDRPLAEVGAVLGLAENAARMRVNRALEKLRGRLTPRGVTSTAAALGGVLAAHPVIAAPVGLAASAAGAAFAGVAAGGLGAAGGIASTMVFMSTIKLTAAALALVATGALGGYWVSQSHAMNASGPDRITKAATVSAPAGATSQGSAPGPGVLAGQRAGGVSATTVSARPVASALDPLRMLMDLQRRKLVRPELKLVSDEVQLTGQFAELFALTPGETEVLQRSIEEARTRLDELQRANTVIGRTAAGDVTLETRPFPEAGGAAYDAMLKVFADTLGSERHQAFLTLGADQIEGRLGRFGTSHGAVTISREKTDAGEVRYRIRSRQHTTPEDNSNYLSDRLPYEELVREVGPLARLLPEDFAPSRR